MCIRDRPVGVPPSNLDKPQIIKIDIDQNNVVYWQGSSVTPEVLAKDMAEIAQQSFQPEVHLRPNKNCKYSVFANVLATSKRMGLTKIAVIGSEQFIQ